jgi:hypothetical protein
MKDLFETPELIPHDVQAILESFDEESPNTYAELDRLVNEIELIGYTFDYGIGAEPYGLRLICVKLNELEGYE